jgi:NhaP-type Na+/H+ and K+/H+ antiporter
MAQLGGRLRRIVDREWIRVGWAGMPTSRHHLLAFLPMIALLIPSMVVEQWSYNAAAAILAVGMLIYGAMIMWIHIRRMAGLGSFSTTRSQRVAKRRQRRCAQGRNRAATDG